MRKTYEKYENEEDLNFGKQKNYPSRRKSTFQAARTAKHTTYVCNVRCVRTCSVRIRTESGRCFIYERNRNTAIYLDHKGKSSGIFRFQFLHFLLRQEL